MRTAWLLAGLTSDEVELQRAIEALENGRESILQQYISQDYHGMTVDIIHQAAIQGDKLAREVFKKRIEYMELAINNLVNIFDPGVVILSYSYTTVGRPEVEDLVKRMHDLVTELTKEIQTSDQVERRRTQLGTRSTVLGSASRLLKNFMDNPKEI